MLEVRNLHAGYGDVRVLKNINIKVKPGHIVSLIGYNGTGKTTLANVISGLIPSMEGQITVDGKDLAGLSPKGVVELGVSQIPEGRKLFTSMTVRENLELGAFTRRASSRRAQSVEMVYSLFPILKERQKQLAGTLSGGEQQMLAIGRGLMAGPKYLLLDEPTLGVAPLVTNTIMDVVAQVKNQGKGVLLIEQNLLQALKIADYAYILEDGKIAKEGKGEDMLNDEDTKMAYLGL